jgi:anti-sigma-K factor RskA
MDHEIPNHEDDLRHIDELLNSFIDGELDQRQQTEVQRLLKHDKQIAERLQSIQKCKMLVSSLPYAEAPKEVLENIKASLEEKKLTSSAEKHVFLSTRREREGAKHLLLRRLTAAAAMIALVAVLAAVIYSIVAPESVPQETEPVAVVATAEKPVETTLAGMEFTARLELKTVNLPEVTAFLNKAIELNIPSDEYSSAVPGRQRESFTLNCGRKNLRLLLADLSTIWDKIDSATLFVETDRPEEQIVIDAVAPQQIIEIAKQDDFETQIKAAKYFAAMNNITERLPGKEVLTAIGNNTPRLLTIPKPVLTSGEETIKKPPTQPEDSRKVHLTITVVEN